MRSNTATGYVSSKRSSRLARAISEIEQADLAEQEVRAVDDRRLRNEDHVVSAPFVSGHEALVLGECLLKSVSALGIGSIISGHRGSINTLGP